MDKSDSDKVVVECDHCGKKRLVKRDTLRCIRKGKQNNLCRSCSKRIAGGRTVAYREKVEYTCPSCGKGRIITGGGLMKIINGEVTGRCRSCAQSGHFGWTKGFRHTEETKKKLRVPRPFQKGELNHRWKGGVSDWRKLLRGTAQYAEWRRQVFIRDEFRCQLCEEVGRRLEAHHIVHLSTLLDEYDIDGIEDGLECRSLWEIDNGVTLCASCHKKVHKQTNREVT